MTLLLSFKSLVVGGWWSKSDYSVCPRPLLRPESFLEAWTGKGQDRDGTGMGMGQDRDGRGRGAQQYSVCPRPLFRPREASTGEWNRKIDCKSLVVVVVVVVAEIKYSVCPRPLFRDGTGRDKGRDGTRDGTGRDGTGSSTISVNIFT